MSELDLLAVGARLREVRGNLSQTDFGARLGLERKTVSRYESGERAPDASALLALLQEFDVDPVWVLTGQGQRPQLANDEMELLSLYRSASLQLKAAAIAALTAGTAQSKGARKQVFRGSVGQVVEGSITNEAGVSFNFGVDKTKE